MISPLSNPAIQTAAKHLQGILSDCFHHDNTQNAVVVYDEQSSLSQTLVAAYRIILPQAQFILFDEFTPDEILQNFTKLKPKDLVVLIQSNNFRLHAFRLRVELFNMKLKALEHAHLNRMENQGALWYIESLAYDSKRFRGLGHSLKGLIDSSKSALIQCGNENLIFDTSFEPAKLNIGDYTGMANMGGLYPIGEVFTEAVNLSAVNGSFKIFAFADLTFSVNTPPHPITVFVNGGLVQSTANSTPDFDAVLASIKQDEGEIWLREVGFGINSAFTRARIVVDVGTYERMNGLHFSLGSKHAVYSKPQFSRHRTKHHVDIFVDFDRISLDGRDIWKNQDWVV